MSTLEEMNRQLAALKVRAAAADRERLELAVRDALRAEGVGEVPAQLATSHLIALGKVTIDPTSGRVEYGSGIESLRDGVSGYLRSDEGRVFVEPASGPARTVAAPAPRTADGRLDWSALRECVNLDALLDAGEG